MQAISGGIPSWINERLCPVNGQVPKIFEWSCLPYLQYCKITSRYSRWRMTLTASKKGRLQGRIFSTIHARMICLTRIWLDGTPDKDAQPLLLKKKSVYRDSNGQRLIHPAITFHLDRGRPHDPAAKDCHFSLYRRRSEERSFAPTISISLTNQPHTEQTYANLTTI